MNLAFAKEHFTQENKTLYYLGVLRVINVLIEK